MNTQTVKIHSPHQRFETGFFGCFLHVLTGPIAHRELVKHLFVKNLLAPYKRSFLGSLWVVISPLAAIISWVLLQLTDILKPGDVRVPYPVYVLVGTLVWALFMRTTTSISSMLLQARYMITHAAFPHEILPGVHILVNLANFGVSLLLSLTVCVLFGVLPSAWTLALPLLIIPLLLCGTAIGLIAAILSPISYDLSRLITTSLGFLMFVSPVIYSPDAIRVPWVATIVRYNPLSYLVGVPRDLVLYGTTQSMDGYWFACMATLGLFAICWRAYFVTQDRLIERLI